MENFCKYYQAHVARARVVEMVGILKSFDHLCFDRTIDTATSLFEFFVPESQEPLFLKVMDYFQKGGMVIELKKLPNRLIKEEVIL